MALTGVTDSLPTIPTCVRRSLFPAPESLVIETLESSICGKSLQRWRNSWACLYRLAKPSRCILPGDVLLRVGNDFIHLRRHVSKIHALHRTINIDGRGRVVVTREIARSGLRRFPE